MLNLRSTYPIAIDIHSQNIYAVQLKETRDGLAVRAMAHRQGKAWAEKALEASDDIVSQLKEMAKAKVFRGKRALVHLPSPYLYTFPISIEVDEGGGLEEAIVAESAKHLPFPIEEATIDYASIVSDASGKANKHKAIIIAARTDQVRQFLLALKQAGLTVEVVDADISSLMRLHRYLHEVNEDPVMLCHVGLTRTLLAVVTRDRIILHRSVPWGIETLLLKLEKNLELSEGQSKGLLTACGFLRRDGKLPDEGKGVTGEGVMQESVLRAVRQIITPYLEELIYEFHHVIGYVMSEEPDAVLQKIYVYGHANFVRDLDRYLETTLNIPTKLVNPMTNIVLPEDSMLPDPSEGAPFSLALGLAMRKVPWL
jgi:type IV pilus assembly protein PilM